MIIVGARCLLTIRRLLAAALLIGGFAFVGPAPAAQQPEVPAAAPAGPSGAVSNLFGQPRFPVRAPAPATLIAAGKALFSTNCSFCHGSNAQGGESGPNLLRSAVVLNDQKGELIAKVVQNGRVEQGMPRFSLNDAQIEQIADFLHSLPLVNRTAADDVNPVTGNVLAGAAYFNGAGHCTDCHSISGDLAGIGAKFPPRALERAMLSGNWQGSGFSSTPNMIPPGTTATITLPSGRSLQGRLVSIDEFSVSLLCPDGEQLTFQRHGELPKVTVRNPLQRHLAMLATLTDKQVHDLTAYLVTLK
jgi:mono/diheme cytochrome c family protein